MSDRRCKLGLRARLEIARAVRAERRRLRDLASFLTVEPDITWAKLHAMAEGAALASKELF